MKFLFSLIVLLYINTAQAFFFYSGEYRMGLFQDSQFSYNAVTHIIVVGSAVKEDSDQFFRSGLSRAMRYKEVFPQDQVIIMSSPEVRGMDDEEVFAFFNVPVIKYINKTFTQELFISEVSAFTRIQSIDFFGHSSPWAIKLGKQDAALDPETIPQKLISLRDRFLPNAYMTISSCNAGYMIAPALSRYLQIPVAGNLTSGLFERIEADGMWYKENDSTASRFVNENHFSFNEPQSCTKSGACVRMKPHRGNYSAYWGTFKEGLSFQKFFCDFDNIDNKCEKGMALSLYTFPSVKPINTHSSIEDYQDILFDWICQTSKDRTYRNKCIEGIKNAVANNSLIYKSHPGNELVCDFKSCHAKVICDRGFFTGDPVEGSCRLQAETTTQPTNAAVEYLAFLKGFSLL